jgi:hypothetical protein
VIPSVQTDLFGVTDVPALNEHDFFAEIVIDRPLDHPYTYGVPNSMRDRSRKSGASSMSSHWSILNSCA